MSSLRNFWGSVLILLSILGYAGPAAADALVERARALVDAGRAAEAYAMLEEHADSRAGDPAFDYVYGIAALDSGHPTEAVFALERVLDAQPDNGPARAELGRAYAEVGEMREARAQFREVKGQEVPPEVRANIDRVLTAIEQHFAATTTQFRPFVYMGLGYDSNVNSATDQNQVAAPGLGGLVFDIDNTSQETDSAIWRLGAGFGFTSPLREDLFLFGRARYDYRLALATSDFTTKTADGAIGLRLIRGQDTFSLSLQAEKFFVDGTTQLAGDRELGGLTAQWQRVLDPRNQVTAFAQAALVRYPEQEVRDVNRYSGGVGWGHTFGNDERAPVMFASVFGGTENAIDDTFGGHLGRDFFAVRVGVQKQFQENMLAFGSATYQMSDYHEDDPAFLETRDDDFVDLGFGVRYQHDRNWSVTPEIRYTNNDSNIIVSDYDRVAVMVNVRNEF